MKTKFKSLSQARAVRDRLAEWAKEDKEEATLEKICRAEGDWRKAILQAKVSAQQNWTGSGIPDWSYLDNLVESIAYIAETERALVKGK